MHRNGGWISENNSFWGPMKEWLAWLPSPAGTRPDCLMKESGEKPSDLQALKFAEKLTATARISEASDPGYTSDIII